MGNGYRFVVIGDGGAKQKLEKAIWDAGVETVHLHPPVSRTALVDAYQTADYLFVHLNDLHAFRRVLPLKSFEYGATDKPILVAVAGYAAQFVREHLPNIILFAPGDASNLVSQLRTTPYHTQPHPQFITRFQRRTIVQAMARQIWHMLSVASGSPSVSELSTLEPTAL